LVVLIEGSEFLTRNRIASMGREVEIGPASNAVELMKSGRSNQGIRTIPLVRSEDRSGSLSHD
jgi:hypothetical protein